MPIDAAQLDIGQSIGRFNTEHQVPAWREAHYAAQAAAELGKGWGEAQDDDSHSSFAWFRGEDGRGLEGVPAVGKGYTARLKIEGLELSLFDPGSSGGRTIADLTLAGRTLDEAMAWMVSVCEERLGPRRQASTPAPDLPEHPVASGARFTDNPEGVNDVADVYDATALTLEKLRAIEPRFGAARCWPHHFDLASLAVVGTDADGAMTKTIGFGITPPDGVDDAGYWYVSPWVRDGGGGGGGDSSGAFAFPELEVGRWHERGGGPAMAVLPVSAVAGESDRSARLAGFVASAINACVGALDV